MHRRLLSTFFGILGFGLFGFVLYLAGPLDVLTEIGKLGWRGFLAVFGDVVLALLFWILSWRVLLSALGIRPRWTRLIGSLASGFAVSYLTPSAYLGGEPVRVMLVGERDTPLTEITATVVVERILASVSTILFASIGGFFVIVSPHIAYFTKKVLLVSLGGLLLFSFFVLWAFVRNYRLLSRAFFALASLFPRTRFFARAARKICEVEETAHRVLSRRPLYALLAFLFQSLAVFCNYMRPQVFFGVGQKTWLTFPQLSLYFSINVIISSFFWITPAGVGIAEGGRMAILGVVGIPSERAVAFVLTFRFLELLFVGIGISYLVHRGVSFFGRKVKPPGPPGPRDKVSCGG
ncbi:MAG: flippase-like domain-containing protein [Caldiserica bacterium]|nr:flippase-like domain-containing protein [Caldisericota bacterium]